jgi:tRNA-specific 2-thiouridylase
VQPVNDYVYPAKKIAVAMSGGVDSSVAALLLRDQGYDIVGVTMKLQNNCSFADSAVRDAKKVADYLCIPHFEIDLSDNFSNTVIKSFCREYMQGRTPNPCIICNPLIKFGALFDHVKTILGADMIATGHYARIEYGNVCRLLKGVDYTKDQSYFLSRLTPGQLAVSIFPLGKYTKPEVVSIALSKKLPVAGRPESQEICFIPGGDYAEFVMASKVANAKPGDIVDINGRKLGLHRGLPYYTIGQRRNIGVALGKPQYVIDIISETNTLVIGDDDLLFHSGVRAVNLNCLNPQGFPAGKHLLARIRYRHGESSGYILSYADDKLEFVFDQPQRAITAGQQLVIYDDDVVVGAGFIESHFQ